MKTRKILAKVSLLTVVSICLAAPSLNAKQVLRCPTLKSLTRGVTVQSALEKPVEAFVVTGQATREFRHRVEELNARPCQPHRTFDEEVEWLLDTAGDTRFESDDWHAPNQQKVKKLLDHMRLYLTNLQTAWFGNDPEWDVYVFGVDSCGYIVGFHYIEVS
jgi:hypothetical protein